RVSDAVLPSTRRDGQAFGSRDGLRGIRWKCTLSSLPAYQSIVVCGAPSLTALMPSCCFGHCSLGCEASRAFVRWFQFPTRLMRMPDGVFANGQNLSQSASVAPTGSELFWQPLV